MVAGRVRDENIHINRWMGRRKWEHTEIKRRYRQSQ
jgi:hypothetical protein